MRPSDLVLEINIFSNLFVFSPSQSTLKTRREAKKSNVTVSMTYRGQGHRGSTVELTQDELKVLQQVNGGENICVFKGMVTPGGMNWECDTAPGCASNFTKATMN